MESLWFLAACTAVLLLFLLAFCVNRYSLCSGFLFDCLLGLSLATLTAFGIESGNRLITLIMVPLYLILGFVLLFGLYILSVYFLLNARRVLKREGHSLSNMLTLICGIALIVFLIAAALMNHLNAPGWLQALWFAILTVLAFVLIHVTVFLTSLILCNLVQPRLNQDYVIVLGSGLIDGKAPPLLQRRIDRAVWFARRQKDRTGKAPVLILSGGQGRDEPCSEACAMLEYAKSKGSDPRDLLLEEQSQSTKENIQFSHDLIRSRKDGKKLRCAVATNNYHLLRAGIYARELGLHASGLGCKTAGYFLPNAVLREYIAYLSLHKKGYLIFTGLLFAATLLLGLLF